MFYGEGEAAGAGEGGGLDAGTTENGTLTQLLGDSPGRWSLFPASVTASSDRNEAGEYRQRDLLGFDCPEIQTDRALNAGDDLLGNTFCSQRLEVVTRVSPAADQTDEFWILGQHGLQRLDEVSRVVVGVHDVDVVAKGVWQIY
jgi:hypothetical protein